MPSWWRVQWLYAVYRCALSFYFLVWLVYNTGNSWIHGTVERHFSFLTNWSFLLWNVYLFVSAVNVSVNQLRRHCRRQKKQERHSRTTSCRFCCTCGEDRSTLCDKVSWLLFTVSAELAVAVTLLYWAILSGEEDSPIESGLNLHVHLLNGIVALLDLWIVGFPVHIFHFLYTFLYASCYVAFTGVHYATNSTGSQEGEEIIYPILDYGSRPGLAAGAVLGVALGLLPLIHVLFICQYLARAWITSRLHKRFEVYRRFGPPALQTETGFNVDDGEMSEAGTSRVTFTTTTAEEDCDV